jgi:hypothetical protein
LAPGPFRGERGRGRSAVLSSSCLFSACPATTCPVPALFLPIFAILVEPAEPAFLVFLSSRPSLFRFWGAIIQWAGKKHRPRARSSQIHPLSTPDVVSKEEAREGEKGRNAGVFSPCPFRPPLCHCRSQSLSTL